MRASAISIGFPIGADAPPPPAAGGNLNNGGAHESKCNQYRFPHRG